MPRYAAAVVVSLSTLFFCAAAADAQYFGRNKVHYDRLDFQLLQTAHFDIYYYAEEEEATRHAARMAERWYARFSRLLGHSFERRQPLVLYASHPHFSQTNLIAGSPGEGTGGFTERGKSRIAMPFAAGLGDTDHVLGHEIAHAFQIDIAKRAKQNAFTLPGWFIEGMAEYLSLGHDNTHTLMWVRDAAQHDRLPTLQQLDDPRYFPYRFGHAFWSYLASRFGDGVVGKVLRAKGRGGVIPRLEAATGLTQAQLTADWHQSIEAEVPSRDLATPLGAVIAAARRDGARLHVAPAISPDGKRVVFVSERDRLSLDLFIADAGDGANVEKLLSTAADPHFDSLQYIHSAGAWDPSGSRFAIAALSGGSPVLTILDATGSGDRQEIRLSDLGEIFTPSWSPDGTRIVFSGLQGGLSDLFVYTRATGELRQLTADAYADLQPAWSPDGQTIAIATDRFSSSVEELRFGTLQVGLLELSTGLIRPLLDEDEAKQVNPQWTPDGSALMFVSDRRGVSNVYRFEPASGELRQVTNVSGGVSGITATSPSLSVASRAGTLAFSVYRNGSYEIHTIDATRAAEARLVPTDLSPPAPLAPATEGTLAELLEDSRTGLPDGGTFKVAEYDDRLRLESVIPPYIGATTAAGFGGVIRASVGATFGDMLRDRQVQTLFRVGTDVNDFAAQAAYINRKGQWNWGVIGGFMPSRFVGARRSIEREGAFVTRETSHLRYLHQWGGLTARYHLNRAQRVELSGGVRRTGFKWQHITRVITDGETVSRDLDEAAAGKPVYLGELRAAFVHDTSVFGATSPVLGQRLRLEIEPVLGGLSFADVRVDARRYFMPVRPVTIAARIEHVGRYGPNASDPRITPLVLGLQTLVRGYDLRRFAIDECGRGATTCSLLDELTGSRFALLNLEVRAPLFGLMSGDVQYGRVPIEAIAFVDAGLLWTRTGRSALERDQFRSIGAGARANVGGLIVEITGARPFDRRDSGWTLSFLLRPGW
jgi:Tol biopolymer transport system component